MKIGIVDHGMGNVLSVKHALEWLGSKVRMCISPESLFECDRIIIPGVGSFASCMKHLQAHGFTDALNRVVIEEKRPTLGICLGMQIMAESSEESSDVSGLGWFEAETVLLQPEASSLKVPHVGWNSITITDPDPLFESIPNGADVYFVHSYWVRCSRPEHVKAICTYGTEVTACIGKENIVATQFHPEKSQDFGLTILKNFLNWNPAGF